MASITPQLFREVLPDEACPRNIMTLNESSSFYIPDCQDRDGTLMEEFRRINELSLLFFQTHFDRCVKSGGGVNIRQVQSYFGDKDYPLLDSEGMIASTTLKGVHVLNRADLAWLKKGSCVCPLCNKPVQVLLSCPLWELKCAYPTVPIPWTMKNRAFLETEQKEIHPSLSVTIFDPCNQPPVYHLIHLVFLIEMAFYNIDPLQKWNFPDGILSMFLRYDPEYTKQTLAYLKKNESIEKTRAWILLLQESEKTSLLRDQIFSFLSSRAMPSDLYYPEAYTKYFLQAFSHHEGYQALLQLKAQCDEVPVDLLSPFTSPSPFGSPSPVKWSYITREYDRCLPIRYLLLLPILVCNFLYFLYKILWPILKMRIFLSGEDI